MTVKTGGVNAGEEAPHFCLADKDNKEICLLDFRGKWVVLYFYPRDNTSGCTREAVEFTGALDEFEQLNAVVIGVSADSVKSPRKFAEQHRLNVLLLSDETHDVLETYGVWQLKKMYGKEFWGTVRGTFLIDPEGNVAHVWRKVKVKGHVETVKRRLAELQ
jgi:peroxiredoxin Q/BCP